MGAALCWLVLLSDSGYWSAEPGGRRAGAKCAESGRLLALVDNTGPDRTNNCTGGRMQLKL